MNAHASDILEVVLDVHSHFSVGATALFLTTSLFLF